MFLDGPVADEDFGTGLDTFMYLVQSIARCQEAGRIPDAEKADPGELAVEMWAISHGMVSLQLANLLPAEHAAEHLNSGARSLLVAWGADDSLLAKSATRAGRRMAELAP
jgi:hypothetical protein